MRSQKLGINSIDRVKALRAIIKCNGNITRAAMALGIYRTTLYVYMKRAENKELMDIVDDARQAMVDNAETKIAEAVDEGEPWAIMTVLKTLGKGRGYTERIEHSGPDGGPIKTVFNHDYIAAALTAPEGGPSGDTEQPSAP